MTTEKYNNETTNSTTKIDTSKNFNLFKTVRVSSFTRKSDMNKNDGQIFVDLTLIDVDTGDLFHLSNFNASDCLIALRDAYKHKTQIHLSLFNVENDENIDIITKEQEPQPQPQPQQQQQQEKEKENGSIKGQGL